MFLRINWWPFHLEPSTFTASRNVCVCVRAWVVCHNISFWVHPWEQQAKLANRIMLPNYALRHEVIRCYTLNLEASTRNVCNNASTFHWQKRVIPNIHIFESLMERIVGRIRILSHVCGNELSPPVTTDPDSNGKIVQRSQTDIKVVDQSPLYTVASRGRQGTWAGTNVNLTISIHTHD